jgi:uridine phosphorylase
VGVSSNISVQHFPPGIAVSGDHRKAQWLPPILREKHHSATSAFTPENLLREARRQKSVPDAPVPEVCILDPDGDIVRYLRATGRARPVDGWACYHSEMFRFCDDGREYGIVGCAVGASYAVLLAEQMVASGCRLLISVTSSGQISLLRSPPYFILIDRALRDEGTSYHYLPPDDYAAADPDLIAAVEPELARASEPVERGATWTTDAPYRETTEAIEAAQAKGILAVEMEAAALYAFARARRKDVICFAHVTNQMGQAGDFEKGEFNGATGSINLISAVTAAWISYRKK